MYADEDVSERRGLRRKLVRQMKERQERMKSREKVEGLAFDRSRDFSSIIITRLAP